MKIRKVKIQAFKSYLKEEDSTFDFSWLSAIPEPAGNGSDRVFPLHLTLRPHVPLKGVGKEIRLRN